MHGRGEKYTENLKGKDHLEDISIHGRIILKG
jgi:hypothetical protein